MKINIIYTSFKFSRKIILCENDIQPSDNAGYFKAIIVEFLS